MITFRISAEVKDDRRVELTLPAEVPAGKAELVVSVLPQVAERSKRPRALLADWADENAEHWGERMRSTDVDGFTGRRF